MSQIIPFSLSFSDSNFTSLQGIRKAEHIFALPSDVSFIVHDPGSEGSLLQKLEINCFANEILSQGC